MNSEAPQIPAGVLRVSPLMTNSLRAKVARTRLGRATARAAIHCLPSLGHRMCESYAGMVRFNIQGAKLRYALGPGDPIGDILFWAGTRNWEREVVPVFCQRAREASGLVLDIGANCGIYSLLACAVNPNARVIAWEPLAQCRERLALSAAANGFSHRIECRPAAVGRTAGSTKFFLHEDPTMGSFTDHSRAGRAIEVRVETVDEVVEDRVDLVKIDVEGHEYEVLCGMVRTMERFHPAIIFECLDSSYWEPIQELLGRYRYELWALGSAGAERTGGYREGCTNYLAVALVQQAFHGDGGAA